MNSLTELQDLLKALEAGGYNAAPSTLVQGSALQREDLSPMMENVCWGDTDIILQKFLRVDPVKTTLVQFDRQLSYGKFGGRARLEGQLGSENTSDYARIVVPMCYYSELRRVTIASTLVDTVDGKKADERAAADAALALAGDIEFHLFLGKSAFSNAGVFDGNPNVIPTLPDMLGLDPQVRQADNERNAQDLMFNSYGGNLSSVIPGGSTLSQEMLEDATTRSRMHHGRAKDLYIDPVALSNYNKLYLGGPGATLGSSVNNQRFWAGEKVTASGADLRNQYVSGGATATVTASRFLSGKTAPDPFVTDGPLAPTTVVAADGIAAGTTFVAGDIYMYAVTSGNEIGESPATAAAPFTVATSGHSTLLTITAPAGLVRFFSVYRTAANGPLSSAKYIGRVINSGLATTVFTDLNNKTPGFVTGFLVQDDTMAMAELSPFTRIKTAIVDLSLPEAFYRFVTLKVMKPRHNVLIENLH